MPDPAYRDLCDWTRKAVDNYSGSDVAKMYIEGLSLDECGDSLFSFMVRELEDAGDAEEAERMLRSASNQLIELIDHL